MTTIPTFLSFLSRHRSATLICRRSLPSVAASSQPRSPRAASSESSQRRCKTPFQRRTSNPRPPWSTPCATRPPASVSSTPSSPKPESSPRAGSTTTRISKKLETPFPTRSRSPGNKDKKFRQTNKEFQK